MNTSPPNNPPVENCLDSDALDHATETQRAVREGRRRGSEQSMQHEADDSRHPHRQPEPPWQID